MPSRQDDLLEFHETEETINKSFLTGYRETFRGLLLGKPITHHSCSTFLPARIKAMQKLFSHFPGALLSTSPEPPIPFRHPSNAFRDGAAECTTAP